MDKLKILQLSCFLTNNIKINDEVIMNLLIKFKESGINGYLPNVLPINELDPKNNIIIPKEVLSFISPNNNEIRKQIVLDRDRFVINYEFLKGVAISELEAFIETESKILDLLLEETKILGKRLAMNITYNLFNNDLISDIIKPPIDFYKEDFAEWSMRINKNSKFKINNKLEIFNIISDYRVLSNANLAHLLEYHIDFNTSQENMQERFDNKSLGDFIKIFKDNKNKFILEAVKY
jgi:hypothetical protein